MDYRLKFMFSRTWITLVIVVMTFMALPLTCVAMPQVLIEAGSVNKYLANNSSPGINTTWIEELFDDSGWADGNYGIGYETGSGAANLLTTTVPSDTRSLYSRSSFTITDVSNINQVTLGVDYDDAYIAWINGVEVFRSSEMPSGEPAWNTNPALHESSNGSSPNYTPLRDISVVALSALQNGSNTLAIGVWNRIGSNGTSSDLVLVPQLSIDTAPIGSTPLFEDDFNDGNFSGWSVINNCNGGSSTWSVVNAVLMQTGDCRGYTADGFAQGTELLTNTTLSSNVDIRLRVRVDDPEFDAVTSNDGGTQKYGAMGVAFGYQNNNNYYRVELSGIKGQRRILRKQNGSFIELSSSPQSYVTGQWQDLRILHQNGVIVVFIDNKQILSAADNSFSAGKLAFFCARNVSCSYDDIVVYAAPLEPVIGLNFPDGGAPTHTSGEYFVDTDGTLDVAALSTQSTGIGGVEFVIDEGTGAEISAIDTSSPYNTQFALSTGEHSVTARLLDNSAVALTTDDASAVFSQVGINGIHIVGLGDSITAGLTDDIALDDVSADTRNTGGGYTPLLNNYLTIANGKPVTVLNEGLSGDKASQAAARIEQVLAHFPQAEIFLVSFGTNDSGGSMPLSSGLGLAPGHQDYPGSYKDYMQQIIDGVIASGKKIYLAKIPVFLKSSGRDAIIQSYNQVIDELMNQLIATYPADYAGYTPPDMYTHFIVNQNEMSSDEIHPNGVGYQSMARLWCEALNTQSGLYCLDDDHDGLLNSVELLQGSNPALADTDGDGLVDGNDGHVLLAAVVGGVDNNGDGYADGEQDYGTDPLLADSDGDRLGDGVEVGNSADPLDPGDWPAIADGDIAPLGNPDGAINAGDFVVGMRLLMGLEPATALELAHGDLYPPGSPDGVFNLQDFLLLQQLY